MLFLARNWRHMSRTRTLRRSGEGSQTCCRHGNRTASVMNVRSPDAFYWSSNPSWESEHQMESETSASFCCSVIRVLHAQTHHISQRCCFQFKWVTGSVSVLTTVCVCVCVWVGGCVCETVCVCDCVGVGGGQLWCNLIFCKSLWIKESAKCKYLRCVYGQ